VPPTLVLEYHCRGKLFHHLMPIDPCEPPLEPCAMALARRHEAYLAAVDVDQVRRLVGKLCRPRCFFDVTVGGERLPRRLIFELAYDVTPRTCANFRALCTGERGLGAAGRPLHYKGSAFFRIIPGFVCQGGDIVSDDGLGSDSIYGGDFDDENFQLKHDRPGMLSMANDGPGTNGSQFFLTCAPAPHLDGAHVVFGSLVEGLETLRRMEGAGTNDDSDEENDGKVTTPVVVVESGVLL